MTDDEFMYTVKREGASSVSISFAGFKKIYGDVNEAAEQLPLTGSMLEELLDKRGGIVNLSINEKGKVVV